MPEIINLGLLLQVLNERPRSKVPNPLGDRQDTVPILSKNINVQVTAQHSDNMQDEAKFSL